MKILIEESVLRQALALIERLVDCSHNYGECSNVRVRDDLRAAIKAMEDAERDELAAKAAGMEAEVNAISKEVTCATDAT